MKVDSWNAESLWSQSTRSRTHDHRDPRTARRRRGTLQRHLSAVAEALPSSFDQAEQLLAPIAGEVWMGSLTLHGKAEPLRQDWPGAAERSSRAVSDRVRAEVFLRDGFVCSYCGGRTGSTGYSHCMINASENSSAGAIAGNVYRQQRILDADPFYLWLT